MSKIQQNRVTKVDIADEIWWFKIKDRQADGMSYRYNLNVSPGDLELVHDHVKEIEGDLLICWHSVKQSHEIWGKTRQEAWNNLKKDMEKWGALV